MNEWMNACMIEQLVNLAMPSFPIQSTPKRGGLPSRQGKPLYPPQFSQETAVLPTVPTLSGLPFPGILEWWPSRHNQSQSFPNPCNLTLINSLVYYPKEKIAFVWKDVCMRIFAAALFIIWRPKSPLIKGWSHTLWNITHSWTGSNLKMEKRESIIFHQIWDTIIFKMHHFLWY